MLCRLSRPCTLRVTARRDWRQQRQHGKEQSKTKSWPNRSKRRRAMISLDPSVICLEHGALWSGKLAFDRICHAIKILAKAVGRSWLCPLQKCPVDKCLVIIMTGTSSISSVVSNPGTDYGKRPFSAASDQSCRSYHGACSPSRPLLMAHLSSKRCWNLNLHLLSLRLLHL